jgi:hypothetical protein
VKWAIIVYFGAVTRLDYSVMMACCNKWVDVMQYKSVWRQYLVICIYIQAWKVSQGGHSGQPV